jgi:hypothetical protein
LSEGSEAGAGLTLKMTMPMTEIPGGWRHGHGHGPCRLLVPASGCCQTSRRRGLVKDRPRSNAA